jgi:hypothetical protein
MAVVVSPLIKLLTLLRWLRRWEVYAVGKDADCGACNPYFELEQLGKGCCDNSQIASFSIEQVTNDQLIAGLQDPRQRSFAKRVLLGKIERVLSNLTLPSAKAGDSQEFLEYLGLASGPIAAYFFGIKSTVGNTVAQLLGHNISRGGLFILFGSLASGVASESQLAADLYRNQAMNLLNSGNNLDDIDIPNVLDDQMGNQIVLGEDQHANITTDLPEGFGGCFTESSQSNPTGFDSTCQCLKTNSCREAKFDEDNPLLSSFSNKGLLSSTLSDLATLTNSIAKGKTNKARTAAKSLASKDAKIKGALSDVQKRINSELKKNKKATIPFAKNLNDIKKKFEKSLSGKTGKEVSLSSLNQARQNSRVPLTVKKSAKKTKISKAKGFSQAGSGFSNSDSSLDLGNDQEILEKIVESTDVKELVTEGEIIKGVHQEQEESIWAILSKGYIRSIKRLIGTPQPKRMPSSLNQRQ